MKTGNEKMVEKGQHILPTELFSQQDEVKPLFPHLGHHIVTDKTWGLPSISCGMVKGYCASSFSALQQ